MNLINVRRLSYFIVALCVIWISSYVWSGHDLILVNWLRDDAYIHIPQSTPSLDIKDMIWYKGTNEIYQLFSQNSGGVDCSGSAYSLMRLYADRGYETYTYHSGKKAFRHVITLVRINHRGKTILMVEDPTYNITYVNLKGNPLDFFEMLAFIKRRKFSSFKIEDGGGKHVFLCSILDVKNNLCAPAKDGYEPFAKTSLYKYELRASIDTLVENLDIYTHPQMVVSGNNNKYPAKLMELQIRNAIISK